MAGVGAVLAVAEQSSVCELGGSACAVKTALGNRVRLQRQPRGMAQTTTTTQQPEGAPFQDTLKGNSNVSLYLQKPQ
ncbi:hypothetical protein CA264_01205 [Pontibacter actiniarum]|uniref:Uncharacterized protein n=1 Tax=Pontibacter actiniarum TaxID=323450 RepID=A0A1X9YMT7_9BACT|nr:hypothetical protein CA264_01205 [Pontibacter actiniarum]